MNDESNGAVRLPLWKACLEEMREQGVQFGQVWKSEFFEKRLRRKRTDMQFGLAVSEIRAALEHDGFFLSGRGQRGTQFVILPADGNDAVLEQYQRAASKALKRGVILGTNTPLDMLSEAQRKRHESLLERIAIKAALMNRAVSIGKYVKKHSPSLLNDRHREKDEQEDAT